jgi:rhodanese-related sulfurtransferase
VQKLKEKGIENAFALVGGTQVWIDAKYPTEGELVKDK